MSNYGGFSGSDGPLVFVSEMTFWDSMESKNLTGTKLSQRTWRFIELARTLDRYVCKN